jgi:hypothetical protein
MHEHGYEKGGMHGGEKMAMSMMIMKNLNEDQQRMLLLRSLDLKIRMKELKIYALHDKIRMMQEKAKLMQEKAEIMKMAREMLRGGRY